MIRRYVYETLNPAIYHGHGKRAPYFEGWYFKAINADESQRYAIIPGIFKGQDGQVNESFVQILDGMTGTARYHRYPVDAFHAAEEDFDVWVGDNHFRRDLFALNIDDDQGRIYGELRFGSGQGWPVRLWEPGVMGWYAWLPIMECYHGVLSFDHAVSGTLHIDGEPVTFDGGRGYIEKDWGQAFPSAYIWFQSNHFDTPNTSLFFSLAIIPSLGRTFAGFLAGFYHAGTLHKLTTYTGARVTHLAVTDDHVTCVIDNRTHRLKVTATRAAGGLLAAPVRTEMHKRVDETMRASLEIRFATRDGRVLFEETGRSAGLEVYGDMDELLSYL